MSVFHPAILLRRVSLIDKALLDRLGVKALILDVDNTLTTHNNPVPDSDVLVWLDNMRAAGIKMMIVSNNNAERILPFAQTLRLDYAANAAKPLTNGFREASKRLELSAGQIAVVGDQIFTDILGGNLFGSPTILVEPMEPERSWLFRVKRVFEIPILRSYRKKKERTQ